MEEGAKSVGLNCDGDKDNLFPYAMKKAVENTVRSKKQKKNQKKKKRSNNGLEGGNALLVCCFKEVFLLCGVGGV